MLGLCPVIFRYPASCDADVQLSLHLLGGRLVFGLSCLAHLASLNYILTYFS